MAVAAAIGVSAFSAYKSNQQQDIAQRRQARAQKKANQVEQRQAELSNARERKRVVEQMRIQNAMNISSGDVSGVSGSSLTGANIAGGASLAGAIGFQNMQLAGNSLIRNTLQAGQEAYARSMSRANNYSAISSLAMASAPYLPTSGG